MEEFGDTEELFPCLPNHQLAAKGEVALEYQAEKERVEMERQREKEEEERKSQEVIPRLMEEEEKRELERRQEREEEERQNEEALATMLPTWREAEEKERQDAHVRFSKKEAPRIKTTPERRPEQALKDITNLAKRKGNTPSVLEMFERTPRMKRPSQQQTHLQPGEHEVGDEKDSKIYCEDFIKRQRITESSWEGEKNDFEIAKRMEQVPKPGNSRTSFRDDGTSSGSSGSDFKAFHSNEASTEGRPTVGSKTENSSHGSETAIGLSSRRKTDLLQLILKLQQASTGNLSDPNFLKEINSTANAIAFLSSPSAGTENLDWRPDTENVPVQSRVEKTPEKSEREGRQDSSPFGLATACPPTLGTSLSTFNSESSIVCPASSQDSESAINKSSPQRNTRKNDPTADKEFTKDELMEPCQVNSKGPQKNDILPRPKQESPTMSRTNSSSYKTVEEVCPATNNWCSEEQRESS